MMEPRKPENAQDQARLRAGLEMVLSRALQTGTASPALRRWLSQVTAKEAEQTDLASLARRLGQSLVLGAVQHSGARETVVEGGRTNHVALV